MDHNLTHEAFTFGDLGNWYEGPWTQREASDGSYEVVHQATGTVLATLPDFAGPIALWMCVARDALPQLLADHDQLRNEAHAEAAQVVDSMLAAEPDHTRASALYEVLLKLRAKQRCTCARSWGLHERACRKYVPGHELLSPVRALAAYRAEVAKER